jgi:dTDP-4-dehydrorhamnose reductase
LKILIFGGAGMAGHMIRSYLEKSSVHELWYTRRGEAKQSNSINLDVLDEERVKALLARIRPDIVINAVGLLNDEAAKQLPKAIYVNGLFPHKLSQYGQYYGFRLIHISTDCVFSGKRGSYTEIDPPDGISVYAKTKSLGEIVHSNHLTIRTSIIGPELKPDGIGLFQWFMKQVNPIQGYRQVFWNGVTTLELAKMIEWALPLNINGLVHFGATEKISKFVLLNFLKEIFNKEHIKIEAYDEIKSDKSLVNMRSDFTYTVPDYRKMIEELKEWMNFRGEY